MGVKVRVIITYDTEVEASDFVDQDDEEAEEPSPGEVREAYRQALVDGDVDVSEELSLYDYDVTVDLIEA